ncbi:MAG TPA: hypothetical protein VKD67_09555 [Acidimicrobiales bacterium]|nr:hypothetical protein [Acidimicrobiales bacterium]
MERDEHEASTSRRALLRWAVAGGGVAAVATIAGATPAAAGGPGTDVTVGSTGNWNTTQTGVVHNGTAQNGPALNAYRTTGSTTGVQYSENAGLVAETGIADNDGVIGFCAGGPLSSGVHGFSFDGRGVVGSGDQGIGVLGEIRTGNSSPNSVAVHADNQSTGDGAIALKATATQGTTGLGGSFAGTRAPLLLVPAATAGAPKTGPHGTGELYVDSNGNLYYCRSGGAPGAWVNLLVTPPPPVPTAASLHPVSPTRVYDSREAEPAPGALSSGQSRTISVADGRAISGGAVTVPNLVPVGATAVAYNFTVTNTVSAGFLTVNPGGTIAITSSAINWSASGQILTTGSLVAINAAREITVIAGGPASATDFVIDVVGYYL